MATKYLTVKKKKKNTP